MKKVLLNRNLNIATLRPITTICTLFHENPSCDSRERLRQAVFLENAITDDKMNLRTSALAPFI